MGRLQQKKNTQSYKLSLLPYTYSRQVHMESVHLYLSIFLWGAKAVEIGEPRWQFRLVNALLLGNRDLLHFTS